MKNEGEEGSSPQAFSLGKNDKASAAFSALKKAMQQGGDPEGAGASH